ncbi:urease subunit gamma [Serratia entomophila]|uniref:urease subunit gamma n=1 Tax=Serratia entomophila TaxID=42906 RepID=UPI00217BC9CA|nr:urease subunit gamma [Serratia entomophila]CAI1161578.1 Urease subunit gamma [Serratia entomophila]CAI1787210.1 Urease subunit gamma [Serratia entomophila]CAI1909187.1 Urease subunit gamma [Serratia entomophila]CAI1911990.1 Urease subunit gamma [Serratia entomophila]CAI1991841.1 Urease subunit gamma [Serratia entomophila]
MALSAHELDKLHITLVAMVAERRRKNGIKLNHPEALAIIQDHILEGARSGKTAAMLMHSARSLLTAADVMDGVSALLKNVTIEATFPDGSHQVTVYQPISG